MSFNQVEVEAAHRIIAELAALAEKYPAFARPLVDCADELRFMTREPPASARAAVLEALLHGFQLVAEIRAETGLTDYAARRQLHALEAAGVVERALHNQASGVEIYSLTR
jgi:DNA-binding transcriptional ArsR family regulator